MCLCKEGTGIQDLNSDITELLDGFSEPAGLHIDPDAKQINADLRDHVTQVIVLSLHTNGMMTVLTLVNITTNK